MREIKLTTNIKSTRGQSSIEPSRLRTKKLKKVTLICNLIGFTSLVLGAMSLLFFVLDYAVAGVFCSLGLFAVSINTFKFKESYTDSLTQEIKYYTYCTHQK